MKRHILYIIFALLATVSINAQSLAQKADSAYSKEDYRLAIKLYHQAIDTDGVSPEIYYNLGNAYYRISNIGRAMLCYQRALNIDPSYADARTNLEFVKTKILDRPEDDSSFLGNLHERIIASCSPNAWAWIALALFLALLGCVALYIFSNNIKARKTGFFGGICLLFVTIYCSVVAFQSSSPASRGKMAVITIPTANLRTEPGSESNDKSRVIPLHEGTLLEITDSITMPGESSKWYNVKINNSTSAWINSLDIELI